MRKSPRRRTELERREQRFVETHDAAHEALRAWHDAPQHAKGRLARAARRAVSEAREARAHLADLESWRESPEERPPLAPPEARGTISTDSTGGTQWPSS